MIKSHKEYLEYLEADRISLNRKKTWRALLFDDVWRFQRLMRKLEYRTNCKKGLLLTALVRYQYRTQGKNWDFQFRSISLALAYQSHIQERSW